MGGLDLVYRGWGYEDTDLRDRAKRTIGLVEDLHAVVVHQWHPKRVDRASLTCNWAYFERSRVAGPLVRNSGRMLCDASDDRFGLTSIVILTHNSAPTDTNVPGEHSLRATPHRYDDLVDNGSTDDTLAFLKSQNVDVLIENDTNRGSLDSREPGDRGRPGKSNRFTEQRYHRPPGLPERLLSFIANPT